MQFFKLIRIDELLENKSRKRKILNSFTVEDLENPQTEKSISLALDTINN